MLMADVLNEFQECEPVQLEPFIHQVGGHSSILCLDERTVCKPLIKQEVKFYETLPYSIKKFTPEYRGIVQVRFEEDQDGYIRVAAYPPKSFRYQVSNKKRPKRRRIRLKNSGSIEIEIESELKEIFVEDDEGATTRTVRAPHNPWALKCHRDHLSQLQKRSSQKGKDSYAQKFVLLENLTWRFEYPCILDLKMGTRQYGDDATPDKIESQTAKAASSTSVQLGVRICGMQVYDVTSGKFKCRNKYYGRGLGVDGFREALTEFLSNGKRLRVDALIPLVEKLQELHSVLQSPPLDTFRFYTSSLLLIYEGLDPLLENNESTSHIISINEGEKSGVCKLGESLSRAKSQDEGTPVGEHIEKGLLKATSSSTEGLFTNNNKTPFSTQAVDVRLIDFAHATHSGLDMGSSGKEHLGSDAGFIFGLSNLIKNLQEIIETHP